MKLLLTTDFYSDEYADGVHFCLLDADANDVDKIMAISKASTDFLKTLVDIANDTYVSGAVQWPLPASATIFDDDDDGTISGLLGYLEFVVVPDNWEIPKDCTQYRVDFTELCIHGNGDLWVRGHSKYSSDYVEINLPQFSLENGQIKITDSKGVPYQPPTELQSTP